MSLRVTLAVGLIAIPMLVLANARPEPWTAIDGDTIDHGGERIRLLRIDAPEMPTSPRNSRRAHCPAGDPHAAKAALQRALDSGEVRCEGERQDRYGRRLAECFVTALGNGQTVNINEWLVAAGYAQRYRPARRAMRFQS
jgi:endonuclease YncB( thermonuclease family)